MVDVVSLCAILLLNQVKRATALVFLLNPARNLLNYHRSAPPFEKGRLGGIAFVSHNPRLFQPFSLR